MSNKETNWKKPRSLKEALKGKLNKKEREHLVASFDVLGNIAIIEIRPELEKKEKIIGEALLSVSKNLETVCKKTAAHKGIYRVEPVKIIAGRRNLTATYRESGCVFKIKLGKVFFSPRLGTERLRISKLIKKGETVAVLFAGVGPFAIVFAKNSKMKKAYAVELNPIAYDEMLENIELNKVGERVVPILGDVKKIAPKELKGKCDRVAMPLPKGGEAFLDEAIACLKPEGGVIHFYNFVEADDPYKEPLTQIRKAAAKVGRKVRIMRKSKVRSFSPAIIQIVVDFRVKSN